MGLVIACCGDTFPGTDTLIVRDLDDVTGDDVDIDADFILVVVDVGEELDVDGMGTTIPAAARSVAIRRNDTCGDGCVIPVPVTRGLDVDVDTRGESVVRDGDDAVFVLTDMR